MNLWLSLGNLFNKEALVHALFNNLFTNSYIKGLKDMVNIKLTPVAGSDGSSQDTTSAQFQCPVSGLEFNGKYKFFALRGCGHVMSAKALKEVKSSSCLVCHADVKDSDKIVINGTEEEVSLLRERMEEEKAKLKEKKSVSKKSKNGVTVVADTGAKVAKRQIDDGNVNGNGITMKKFKAADKVPVNATKSMLPFLLRKSMLLFLLPPRRSLISGRLTLAGHFLSAGTDMWDQGCYLLASFAL